jgi:hypothetical protein
LRPPRLATWPNGEWGYSTTRRHMLEPVLLEAVLPDRASCLPTFSHLLIVNKTSLSLSLLLPPLSLGSAMPSPCGRGRDPLLGDEPYLHSLHCELLSSSSSSSSSSFSQHEGDEPRVLCRLRPGKGRKGRCGVCHARFLYLQSVVTCAGVLVHGLLFVFGPGHLTQRRCASVGRFVAQVQVLLTQLFCALSRRCNLRVLGVERLGHAAEGAGPRQRIHVRGGVSAHRDTQTHTREREREKERL